MSSGAPARSSSLDRRPSRIYIARPITDAGSARLERRELRSNLQNIKQQLDSPQPTGAMRARSDYDNWRLSALRARDVIEQRLTFLENWLRANGGIVDPKSVD